MWAWVLFFLAASPARRADAEALLVSANTRVAELIAAGDPAAALGPAQEGVEAARVLGTRTLAYARALSDLGVVYERLGRYVESIAAHEVALRVRVRHGGPILLVSMSNLAAAVQGGGDLARARAIYEQAWTLLTTNNVQDPIALTIASNYGNLLVQLGELDTAIVLLQWVLSNYELTHPADAFETANACINLAHARLAKGDTPAARALYTRALAAVPDHPVVASAYASLGKIELYAGEVAAARAHLERAVAVSEALGSDHPYVGAHLLGLADLYAQVGDPARRPTIDRALAILTEPTLARAAALGLRADLRLDEADLAGARADFEAARALVAASSAHDPGDLDSYDASLALIDVEEGRYASARARIDAAIAGAAARLGAAHPDVAMLRAHRARIRMAQGETREARTEYETALATMEAAWGPDSLALGDTLSAYGALLLARGEGQDALVVLRRAEAIQRRGRGEGSLATTPVMHNLAVALGMRGDYAAARRLLEQTLEIERSALGSEHPNLAATLHSLGMVSALQGDAVTARTWLERALALKEKVLGPDHPELVPTLSLLGDLRYAEEPAAADAIYLRAESVAITAGVGGAALADLRARRGFSLLAAGRHAEAADAFRVASEAVAEASAATNDTAIRYRLFEADVWLAAGELDRAARVVERVTADVGRARALDPSVAVEAAERLATVLERQGRRDEGRAAAERALRLAEVSLEPSMRGLSERERVRLVGVHRAAMDRFLALHDRPEDATQAWAAVLRWKGAARRSMIDTRVRADGPAAEVVEALAATRASLSRALYATERPAGAELARLTEEKERLERELAALVPGAAIAASTPADVCGAVPPGAALVDIVQTAASDIVGYEAFVVESCSVRRVGLGAAGPIDAAVERYRALLAARAPSRRTTKAGAELRASTWDRLGLAGDGLVLIVPDGTLAVAPWAALPVGGGFLVEQRAVAQLESVAALDAARTPGSGALVVGGVAYGAFDDAAPASCVSGFAPLPATMTEAQAVAARLADATVLSGADATERAVSVAVAGRRYVHLATHGFYAGDTCRAARFSAERSVEAAAGMNPMLLSGMALAGANARDDGAAGDGLWTAEEIAGLDLRAAELVVLSACESGLGAHEPGEGVMGLRRAFSMAGAGALVLTLWPVEDRAAAALVDGLYAHLDLGPVGALRAAQLEALASARARGDADPGAWGAFTVSGAVR